MNCEIANEEETVTVELRLSGLCFCDIPKNEWEEVWKEKIQSDVGNGYVQNQTVWDMESKFGTGNMGSEWKVVDVEESL